MHIKLNKLFSILIVLGLFAIVGCMNNASESPSKINVLETSTLQITSYPFQTQAATPISSVTKEINTPTFLKLTATVIGIPNLSNYVIDDLDLIKILEPYNAKLNSNGFMRLSSKDDRSLYRITTVIDTSPASKYPISLTISLIYNEDPTTADRRLMEIEKEKISEGFINLPVKGKIQFPEKTWILEKDNEVLELGTVSGPIGIYVTMQSNPLFIATHDKFIDLNSAKTILLDIATIQFNRINN